MKNQHYQIIEKCKAGDIASMDWLYRKYAPILLGICLRYINDRMEAEDVLHESFITIYEKIGQFKHKGSFEGWIKRIMVNKALNYLQANNTFADIEECNEPATEEQVELESTNIKEMVLHADFSKEEILKTVQSLPDGFRTVFNLYVFENYKHKAIAHELGISVGTSKSQLLRARKLIQKRLYDKITEKPKKQQELKHYAALFMINSKLNYIDKLTKKKLTGYKVQPASKFSANNMSQAANTNTAVTHTTIGQIKTHLASLTAKKIFWITSAMVGTTAVIVGVHSQKPDPVKIEPVVFISDSLNIDELYDELEIIDVPTKQTQPAVIYRKKTIRITKPIYVKDTIIITDTINRKR